MISFTIETIGNTSVFNGHIGNERDRKSLKSIVGIVYSKAMQIEQRNRQQQKKRRKELTFLNVAACEWPHSVAKITDNYSTFTKTRAAHLYRNHYFWPARKHPCAVK